MNIYYFLLVSEPVLNCFCININIYKYLCSVLDVFNWKFGLNLFFMLIPNFLGHKIIWKSNIYLDKIYIFRKYISLAFQ